MSANPSQNAAATLDDIRIIDTDSHFTEPPELWTSRAPARLRDRMPVQRTVDGLSAWYAEGQLWTSLGTAHLN